jgi:DNA-binding transcriptional ArsR family regulator
MTAALMALTLDETTDLREIIRFAPSAPAELLIGLGAVQQPPARLKGWAAQVRAMLEPEWLEEIRFFTEDFWHTMSFMDLVADYDGPLEEADGFIEYIAGMDEETFLYYLWGRLIPHEEIPTMRQHPERLVQRMYEFYEAIWPGSGRDKTGGPMLARSTVLGGELQVRLVRLLRVFNERVFRPDLPELRQRWAVSIAEQRTEFGRTDPATFLSRMFGSHILPPMFPEGTPLRELRLIPSYYLRRSHFEIWGHGSVFLFYDAGLSSERLAALDQEVQEISELASALSDPNRLKILRAISQDEEVYGHKLARICGISQPAVSRHMGILKRAGLVEEVPSDGRVLYRLRRATFEELAPRLRHYLGVGSAV